MSSSQEPEGFKASERQIYSSRHPEPFAADTATTGIHPAFLPAYNAQRRQSSTLEDEEGEDDNSFLRQNDDDPISMLGRSRTLESTTAVLVPKPGTTSRTATSTNSPTTGGEGGKTNTTTTRAAAAVVKNHHSTHQASDQQATILVHAEAVLDTLVRDVENNAPPTTTNTSTPPDNNNTSKSVPVTDQQTKKRRHMWIAAIVALFLIGGVVGIVLAVMANGSGGGSNNNNTILPTFTQVGGDVTPNNEQGPFFGSDVAVSSDGRRVAVASISTVTVYEMKTPSSSWQQLGQTINVLNDIDAQKISSSEPKLFDHGLISLAMRRQGDIIAVGYGEVVNVYQYNDNNTWVGLGRTLFGNSSDQFGTAVDLSDQGPIRLAVGAPGYNNGTGSVEIFQYNNVDWTVLGNRIEGDTSTTVQGLGGSVSLSGNGTRVAAAGRSLLHPTAPTPSPVVRTFDYQTDSKIWKASDAGYPPPSALKTSTGWTVDLSADGNRMVISNSYLTEEDFLNIDPAGLFVRVFAFSGDEWNPYGGTNLHGNKTGPKSGYVVALSDDGSVIAMGDPGTSSGGRNVNGHAHIYRDDPGQMSFNQSGSDLVGKNNADAFGFSVAVSGDGRKMVVGIPRSRAADDVSGDSGLVQVFEL
jgi:hypothetical protein